MLNRKKILIIGLIASLVLCIIILLMYKVSTNNFKQPVKNELSPSHNIETKKRIQQNIKVAEKENERMKKIEEFSEPDPDSKPMTDNENYQKDTAGDKIKIDNSYFLFGSKALNIDQYIDAESKLNLAVNELESIKKVTDLNQYFNENKESLAQVFGLKAIEDLSKIRDKIININSITTAHIVENSLKTENGNVSLHLQIKDVSNKQIQFNINILLKEKDCDISW